PFLAVTIAAGALIFKRSMRAPILGFVTLCFLISGLASSLRVDHAAATQPSAAKIVNSHDTLFIDSTRRGVIPGILWHAKPNQRVFAQDQSLVRKSKDRWLTNTSKHKQLGKNPLYIGGTTIFSNKKERNAILELLHKNGYRDNPVGSIELWYP